MEAKLIERLRVISSYRSKLLDYVQIKIPIISYLNHTAIFHSVLIATTVTMITVTFLQIRTITLFSFHPVLMSIGIFCLLGEGMVAYRNHSLYDSLSPIMQHNSKQKIRTIHQTCQVLGSSCIFLGLLFILAHKIDIKKSLLSFSLHSLFGLFTVLLIIIQIIIGVQKTTNYIKSSVSIRRWHGDFGQLIYDLLFFTAILGCIEFFINYIQLFFIILIIIITWITIYIQMRKKSSNEDELINGSSDSNDELLYNNNDINNNVVINTNDGFERGFEDDI